MKNRFYFISLALISVFILSACSESGNIVKEITSIKTTLTETTLNETASNKKSTEIQEISNPIPESVDTIPITRATVAKMIALAFNDKNTIHTTDIEIEFDDVSEQQWYSPYINTTVLEGYMSGTDSKFHPDEPLTLQQAQLLLDKLNPDNKTKIKMTDDIADKPISYALWIELYIKMLEESAEDKNLKDMYNISIESLIVLSTPANNTAQSAWTMTTDKGNYSFTGLNMDSYIDTKIKAYTKENELIGFISVEETQPTITNAYLIETTEESLKIFVGGTERIYKIVNEVIDKSAFTTPIIDIKISQGTVLTAIPAKDMISGKLMRADTNYIELAGKGKLEMTDDIKVYSNIDNKIEWKAVKNIVSGTDIADYILKEGKICAAIITKDLTPEKIRVVIGTTGFKELIHSDVKLTATTDYSVSFETEVKEYKKGDVFEFNHNLFKNTTRIYVKPVSEDGRIELQNITRNSGQLPQYRGTIEIAEQGDSYSIVNEVGLEEYLYSVVPSEMPTSYGIEAAKVQAITARSYAYNQIFSNKYYKYGANVDDSIQSQVYNNTPENQNSTKAVDETKGQVLTYEGAVISANFFSTSSGSTANSGEVWMNTSTKEFPASTPAYLTTVRQYTTGDYGDLSQEDNAAKFFKAVNIDSYDSDFSWFRWNVTMNIEELSASINANLKERYIANKSAIKTLVSENIYRSRDIETIGTLKDLQVVKRGEGGNIMEMLIVGTDATIKVVTEYNIRSLLKPLKYLDSGKDVILNRKDGSKLANYSLMPSSFFTMEKNLDDKEVVTSITFYGGGNGHGAGMSQNGVKTMSDDGYTCEQILLHYYKDTQINTIR